MEDALFCYELQNLSSSAKEKKKKKNQSQKAEVAYKMHTGNLRDLPFIQKDRGEGGIIPLSAS